MCKNKKQETKALRQGGKRLENHLDIVHQVLEQVILGKREEIREVMLAFLAKGHVLLEDIPGVGKTILAVAFSRTMLLDYKRVQYTGWNTFLYQVCRHRAERRPEIPRTDRALEYFLKWTKGQYGKESLPEQEE